MHTNFINGYHIRSIFPVLYFQEIYQSKSVAEFHLFKLGFYGSIFLYDFFRQKTTTRDLSEQVCSRVPFQSSLFTKLFLSFSRTSKVKKKKVHQQMKAFTTRLNCLLWESLRRRTKKILKISGYLNYQKRLHWTHLFVPHLYAYGVSSFYLKITLA